MVPTQGPEYYTEYYLLYMEFKNTTSYLCEYIQTCTVYPFVMPTVLHGRR